MKLVPKVTLVQPVRVAVMFLFADVPNMLLISLKAFQRAIEDASHPWSGALPSFDMMKASVKSDLQKPAKKTSETPDFANNATNEVKVHVVRKPKRKPKTRS